MTNKTVLSFILLIIIALGITFYLYTKEPMQDKLPGEQTQTATSTPKKEEPKVTIKNSTFICSDKTSGTVTYNIPKRTVTVKVNQDIYNLILTTTTSGNRYTNEDESFVFLEKDNSVSIEVRGELRHTNCVLSTLN